MNHKYLNDARANRGNTVLGRCLALANEAPRQKAEEAVRRAVARLDGEALGGKPMNNPQLQADVVERIDRATLALLDASADIRINLRQAISADSPAELLGALTGAARIMADLDHEHGRDALGALLDELRAAVSKAA